MKEELYDLVEIRVKFSDFQSGFRSWGCSWKPALVHSSEKLIHFCQEWYFCQTVGSSHVLSPVPLNFHKDKNSSRQETEDTAKTGGSPVWQLCPGWAIWFFTSFSQRRAALTGTQPSTITFLFGLQTGKWKAFFCPLKLRDTAWIPGYNHGYLRPDVQFWCTRICTIFSPSKWKKQRWDW